MLSGVRVLDLTDHRGRLAGAILAALGAEVVLVEPPGGAPGRRRPPLAAGVSLDWWAYNRGKHSVICRSEAEVAALLAEADVVLESPDPGERVLNGAALDREALAAAHPALVHVTITAFGSSGPKARWPASDLTVAAAGCQLALTGDADRPPVRTSVAQAFLHAGAEAACGALLALTERRRSGRGQHVDVSAQQAFMQAAIPGVYFAPNDNAPLGRISGGIAYGPYHLQFVYPAADGHVSITLLFGATIGRFTTRLMDWVEEEGLLPDELRGVDWLEFAAALAADPVAAVRLEAAKAAVAALTAGRTKAELFAEARRRELLLAPVATPAELFDSEQLAARGFWDEVEDPTLGRLRAPGPFARLDRAPLRRLGSPPAVGAGPPGGARTRRPPGAPAGGGGLALDGRPALEGLKVVDLTWVYAGPLATRVLAEHGATVVKIEGPGRPDAGRGGGGALAGDHGPEASLQFASMNADKLGLALDLNTPAGREVLVDLARWADVLVESYTPGVMDAWGLGADALHAANPELIVLSTSLMGQSGPLRGFAGFGNLAAAVCGFYELTGWPDRAPAGPFLAYTDYLAPRLTTAVLLAALERRAREGGGERIDFSQAEAAIHFLAPALVEHEVLGAARGRLGNDDPALSPHGVFPCAGDDAWVAVVCETDEQWRALTALVDGPALAGLGAEARLARRDELAALVAGWTGRRSAAEAEAALIEAGVPAHRVQNSGECWADPQLAHLGHWRRVPHPKHGSVVIEGPRVRLSRSPAGPHRAGPLLGEHNELVLRDLLGYDDDRIAQLIVDGALG